MCNMDSRLDECGEMRSLIEMEIFKDFLLVHNYKIIQYCITIVSCTFNLMRVDFSIFGLISFAREFTDQISIKCKPSFAHSEL